MKIELLAPVGSYESLTAAINAKCDAVYFGVTQLNMRSRSSDNFTLEDLLKISKICKKHKIKTYLTINTILYDHDINIMHKIVDAAKKHKIDAIIVSDFAAILYARKIGVDVHISTQVSISNIEALKFFAQFSDRVVLARELTLDMIREISKNIKKQNIRGPKGNLIELEAFAHGAMCIAISGRCGMSLFTHNSSANRGACKQNCRRPYKITDLKGNHEMIIDNEYVMSPKDICTINFLDKFINAGISVLKIEGRGRSADYVDVVIKCYREALDAISNETYTKSKIENWMKRLASVYNRGFSDGYYLGKKIGEWSHSDNSLATEEKLYIARIQKYWGKAKVVELKVEAASFEVNDKFIITGAETGVLRGKISELRSEDGKKIKKAEQGMTVTFPFDKIVKKNDKFYICLQQKSL
jgi:putative protease